MQVPFWLGVVLCCLAGLIGLFVALLLVYALIVGLICVWYWVLWPG